MTTEGDWLNPELMQDYLDNRLGDTTRRNIEAYLDRRPEARLRLQAYREQEAALHELYDGVLREDIPERLRAMTRLPAAARGRDRRRRGRGPWGLIATAAVAAGMLSLGGMAGWTLRGNAQQQEALQLAANDFVHQASNAFSLYSMPDTPWSDSAGTDFAGLLGWVEETLGVHIAEGALRSAGYSFVAGRPLPFSNGLAGEIVFRNGEGQRLTLYFQMRATSGGRAPARPSGVPPGTYVQRDNFSIYYWQSEPVSVALIGPLQESSLVELAKSVFQQPAPPKVEM